MSDPLDSTALLLLLPTLLPRSTSSPLVHPVDALAALIHTIHTALDFRLVPLANNQGGSITQASSLLSARQGEADTDIDDGASDAETAVEPEEDQAGPEGRLPEGWNARGEDSYVFEYRHAQSAMTFRIRDGAPHNVSVVLTDLLTPPAFPIPSSATASGSSATSSAEAPAKSIGFRSFASVKAFVEQYKRDVVAKLLPGLRKEGYNEPWVLSDIFKRTLMRNRAAASGSDPRNPPPAQPRHEPSPARPEPFFDPMHPLRTPYNNPASVGRRDLDPLAAFQPPGSFNPRGDGGGMYVDFNHPLFDNRRRQDPDLMGGPGGLIQPPGARWDPVGPGAGGAGRFPGPGGNPLGGVGLGDDRWGDEMPPPGEFGPDMGRMGGLGGPRPGGGRGGGFGGLGGPGGGRMGGGGFGGRGGFGGGGFGGGGGMYM